MIIAKGPVVRLKRQGYPHLRTIQPFIQPVEDSGFVYLAIGYCDLKEKLANAWMHRSRPLLLRSWRTMKILEHLEYVDVMAISYCWSFAGREEEIVSELPLGNASLRVQHRYGSLRDVREKVLSMKPSRPHFDEMLRRVIEAGVIISAAELSKEVELGMIERTSLVEECIARDPTPRIAVLPMTIVPRAPAKPKLEVLNLPTNLKKFFGKIWPGLST